MGNNYLCDICNYITKRKSNYIRHCQSIKHTNKKRQIEQTNPTKETSDLSLVVLPNDQDSIVVKKDEQIDKLTSLVETLIYENKGLQDKLVEIAAEPKVIYGNNNNNKTVNIIQYLNTECKDALNLSDFIESIPIDFKDIEDVKHQGYLKSIENTFIKSLFDLEQDKRPIHCTDKKRKQFYIKDQDQWSKDNQQSKTKNYIDKVNTKQLATLQSWKEDHPSWNNDDRLFDKICDIQRTLLSMYSSDRSKQRMVNKIMSCLTELEVITN